MGQASVQIGIHRFDVGVDDSLCSRGREELVDGYRDGEEDDSVSYRVIVGSAFSLPLPLPPPFDLGHEDFGFFLLVDLWRTW